MKFSTHSITQILLTLINGGAAISGIVPPKYSWAVVGGISLVQSIIGLINHADPSTIQPPAYFEAKAKE